MPILYHDPSRARKCGVKRVESPETFWTSLTPVAKRDLLARIIETVTVYESSVDIKFKTKGDKRLMEEFKHEHNGN